MSTALSMSDIIRQALGLAGEVDTGNSQYHSSCVPWGNKIHEDVLSGSSMFNIDVGQVFPWAISETPKALLLRPAYESGGVTLTQGSVSGVFSVAPSSSLGSFVDRFLKLDESQDYYRITAHVAGATAFTIDSAWAPENVTVASFKAIPIIYDLGAGVLRLVAPITMYRSAGYGGPDDSQCYGIHVNQLKRNYPLTRITATAPERFAEVFRDESKFKIQFSSYVTEDTKVDLDWVPIPDLLEDSVSSFPRIPSHKREFMVYALAAKIAAEKKNWEAFGNFGKIAGGILASMLQETNRTSQVTSKRRGELVPRLDQLTRTKFWGA